MVGSRVVPRPDRERGSVQCKSCHEWLTEWRGRCPYCQGWTSGSSGPRVVARPSATPDSRRRPNQTANPPPRLTVVRDEEPALVSDVSPDVADVVADPDFDSGKDRTPTSVAVRLPDVEIGEGEDRIMTGIEPLDRVLGGGLVVGSLIILGGDPGTGKSSILWQVLDAVQQPGARLYATGEESVRQVTMTARRIGAANPQIHVVHETQIESVLWHARELQAAIVVVDSIHCAQSEASRGQPGSDHQVKACCHLLRQYAKSTDTTVLAVSHVNKDGDVSGAMALEHLGDATLMLSLGIEGTDIGAPWRELRAKKNRFGSTLEVGLLQMTNRGLVAAGEGDAADLADRRRASQERADREGGLVPVVHELLRRYAELGGIVDDDLAGRLAGKVDLQMIGVA